jgi:hypothetical protein
MARLIAANMPRRNQKLARNAAKFPENSDFLSWGGTLVHRP